MEQLTYFDFNNNTYKITRDQIHYLPMTPIESSSGVYSGGEEKRVEITLEDFAEIVDAVRSIIDDGSLVVEKRRMLTVVLLVTNKTGRSKYIIRRCNKQKVLQDLLKRLLA